MPTSLFFKVSLLKPEFKILLLILFLKLLENTLSNKITQAYKKARPIALIKSNNQKLLATFTHKGFSSIPPRLIVIEVKPASKNINPAKIINHFFVFISKSLFPSFFSNKTNNNN